MDKPISVGDLVISLRTHCLHKDAGVIWRVAGIRKAPTGIECPNCQTVHSEGALYAYPDAARPNELAQPLKWLKRIPPLEELEGEKHHEEIQA